MRHENGNKWSGELTPPDPGAHAALDHSRPIKRASSPPAMHLFTLTLLFALVAAAAEAGEASTTAASAGAGGLPSTPRLPRPVRRRGRALTQYPLGSYPPCTPELLESGDGCCDPRDGELC